MKENKSLFIKMSADDISKIKSFCEVSKMIYNDKVDNYDFNASKSNIRLCNFGKSDVCRTASMWYSPKRCDFGLRIEKDTLTNLCKSDANKMIVNTVKSVESQETNKQNEFRYSFVSLADMLKFFSDLQKNYRVYVAKNKATKEIKESETLKA